MWSSERSRAAALIGSAGLAAAGATFVILYFQLAKSSRFPPDDLCIFSHVQELGVWGAQLRLFRTWSGRWASNLLVTLVMGNEARTPSLFLHALALLSFAVVTVWATMRAVAADRVGAGVAPVLAVVTVALAFFATPHQGDSWFFAFSSVENLVPVCCGALALACVLRADARPWLVVPGAIAAAVAAGGHECVSLTWLSVGYALLAWAAVRMGAGESRIRSGAIVLAVATASFVVCAASPGAAARATLLRHAPAHVAIGRALLGGPRLVAEIVLATLPVLAAIVLVWAWATRCFARDTARASAREVASVALALAALSLVAGFATALPGYYALGEAPPTRAQLALAIFLIGAAAVVGVQLGSWLRGSARSQQVLAVSMLVLVAVVFQRERARLIPEIAAARIYARAYDARMATLREAAGRDQRSPVLLDPLPPSGLLRTAEVSPDKPRSYANRCLARAVGLRGGVLRRPDSPGS